MELNQFLFPAPTPSYSSSGFIGDLIYIPKYNRNAAGEVIQFKKSTSNDQESKDMPFAQSTADAKKDNEPEKDSSPIPKAMEAIQKAHARASLDKE